MSMKSRTRSRQPVDAARVAAAQAQVISHEDAHRMTALLGLLADPVRARILHALDSVEELCVGDIVLALNVTDDATGYALRVLRTAGFVTGRRTGHMVYYRITDEFPIPLREHCLRRLVDLLQQGAQSQGRDGDEGQR